jgi:phosphoribosylformylglycinamidine cyclo-ligase
MPDLYRQGEYDLSGTIIGVVDKANIINGKKIKRGDVLVGVNSSGLHTNGYSLARRILLKKLKVDSYIPELGRTLGAELLQVHLSYLHLIQSVLKTVPVKGIAHITGGGIIGNTRRLLQAGLSLQVDWQAWSWPPIFKMIKRLGQVPESDMRSTFNLGIGLVFIIKAVDFNAIYRLIKANRFQPYLIGEVI